MSTLRSSDFVLWDATERRFANGRGHFSTLASANEYLERKVAPEITQLVDELTRYFGAIGMHDVCRACFSGTLEKHYPESRGYWAACRPKPGEGCCAPCGLQGREGCLSKPLGCALWMCSFTADKFPEAYKLLENLKSVLQNAHWNDPSFRSWNEAGSRPVLSSFFTDARPESLSSEARKIVLRAVALVRKARTQIQRAS